MKKINFALLFFTAIQQVFADIPIDDGYNSSGFAGFNLLPWILIFFTAVSVLTFLYALKKNRK